MENEQGVVRDEKTVLEQLQNWGQADDNIRALLLTSSRADPTRSPDRLSDYDVEVYVRDVRPFVRDDAWVEAFGEVMVRWPLRPQPTLSDDWVTQLVLFEGGVRIDFQMTATVPIDAVRLTAGYRVLLDKDALAAHLPQQGASRYGIDKPTQEDVAARLNAFWWDIVYVAKALRREELDYAKFMLDYAIRVEKLHPLMAWHVGLRHDWETNVGLYGRWFRRYFDADTWAHYERTFAGADLGDNWRALGETLSFARLIGHDVARGLGVIYPEQTDAKVTRYIEDIRTGPL